MQQAGMIYLGLGTNLGDRAENLRTALARLTEVVRVTAVSSVYETEPWGIREQPRFLNMAVGGVTELEPEALLAAVKNIEREMGRTDGVRYGPRLIDIDILLYDDRIVSMHGLVIPHPRLAERAFVLVPLAEIAGDVVPPGFDESVATLAARHVEAEGVRLYESNPADG